MMKNYVITHQCIDEEDAIYGLSDKIGPITKLYAYSINLNNIDYLMMEATRVIFFKSSYTDFDNFIYSVGKNTEEKIFENSFLKTNSYFFDRIVSLLSKKVFLYDLRYMISVSMSNNIYDFDPKLKTWYDKRTLYTPYY
jgi:hypothetical protein